MKLMHAFVRITALAVVLAALYVHASGFAAASESVGPEQPDGDEHRYEIETVTQGQ